MGLIDKSNPAYDVYIVFSYSDTFTIIKKTSNVYTLQFYLYSFKMLIIDEQKLIENEPLSYVSHELEIDKVSLDSDLYGYVYNYLKSTNPNYEDYFDNPITLQSYQQRQEVKQQNTQYQQQKEQKKQEQYREFIELLKQDYILTPK